MKIGVIKSTALYVTVLVTDWNSKIGGKQKQKAFYVIAVANVLLCFLVFC